MLTPETIIYTILGGIAPSLIWLYFLLKEDDRCPEPRAVIALAFLAGAIAVLLALPFERIAVIFLAPGISTVFAWATIEETLKYGLAALLVLWRREVNESIDIVIYMLTVALGFAALENALFLIAPFSAGQIIQGIVTDNLRFVGSTLLHVIASSTVGFVLAFSYKYRRVHRAFFVTLGLILAIALHTLFNFLIIHNDGAHTIFAFFVVWVGAIVFFALFEVLKYFRYRGMQKNVC